ncbi:hypothetical protein BS614_13630 [Paenibacillus xylanexedens]|uniref:hypothetical protein n=1 Tax=Paenibacillus xylanexedens TaxID=528191 RepID=UPI0009382F14|nr:hypothetical protein [Paenibacillus xylanexedens]APO44946.1 hypothetical protein BS614_13630 [Paenibacillus xylanexedens]
MKRIALLVLFCLSLVACSNQNEIGRQQNEKSKPIFKVKAEYSSDIGGEFAKSFMDFHTHGWLFKDLGYFKEAEYSDSEDLQLFNLLDKINYSHAIASTPVELEMLDLMESYYSIVTELKGTKLEHERAIEYEAIGVQDKKEYLNFEEIGTTLETEGMGILEKFKDYIEYTD